MSYEKARQIIQNNSRIAFLSGVGMTLDSNIPDYISSQESYKAELEYDYSPEDLFSSVFYNTRPDLFFRYYKKYILFDLNFSPNEGHYAVAALQKQNKLTGISTRSIYGLHQAAGASDVIELHGSIHNNVCTNCGRTFDIAYIKNSRGIPTCDHCEAVIRPKVALFGERLDNGLITKASNMIESANVLLVAGIHLHSHLVENFLQYFNGDDIIVVNDREHFSDDKASQVLYGNPKDILPQLIY